MLNFRDFMSFLTFGYIETTETINKKIEATKELLNDENLSELDKIIKIMDEPDKYMYNKQLIKEHLNEVNKILTMIFKTNNQMKILHNYLQGLIFWSQL